MNLFLASCPKKHALINLSFTTDSFEYCTLHKLLCVVPSLN